MPNKKKHAIPNRYDNFDYKIFQIFCIKFINLFKSCTIYSIVTLNTVFFFNPLKIFFNNTFLVLSSGICINTRLFTNNFSLTFRKKFYSIFVRRFYNNFNDPPFIFPPRHWKYPVMLPVLPHQLRVIFL